eukprot:scaffold467_cov366-Pavlova_lutheri.AAC.26
MSMSILFHIGRRVRLEFWGSIFAWGQLDATFSSCAGRPSSWWTSQHQILCELADPSTSKVQGSDYLKDPNFKRSRVHCFSPASCLLAADQAGWEDMHGPRAA